MSNIIQHKRNATPGAIPTTGNLSYGELAINYSDGKLYTKRNDNTIINLAVSSISGTVITPASGYLQTIQFDTNAEPNLLKGQVCWNDTDGTLNVALTDDTDIHVGEHRFYRVRNDTGSILYKGQAIYATGVHANGIINPSLYTANGSVREVRFIGLMLEDLNPNNNGYAIDFGHLEIDTRGNVVSPIAVGDETWAAGDILYIHPTVAGKLTKVEPKHSISVAIVLIAASNGLLFIRPTSYGHIDDNHDVNTSGVTNNQYLRYDSSSDTWLPTSSGIFNNVYASGNVGIGTVTPSGKLHVVGDQYNNGNIYLHNTSVATPYTYNQIRTDAFDSLILQGGANTITLGGQGGNIDMRAFSTNVTIGNSYNAGTTNQFIRFMPANTEAMRITNAGNVGIGTVAPSGTLHVVGTGIISSKLGVGTNNPTYDLDVRTNSTNAFYVTQGGGARYLSLDGNGFINNTTLAVSKTSWNNLGSLELSTSIASRRGVVVQQVASQTANAIETRDNSNNVLSYIGADGGSYFAGNVGIGTTTPSTKLHVNGSALIGKTFFSDTVYSFGNGILIATDIATTDNFMCNLTIEGNSYDTSKGPIFSRVQFYNYVTNSNIISTSAISTDKDFTIDVFHYNGYVYLWFAQTASFQSYTFKINTMNSGKTITAITNAIKPTSGVTNSVTITPYKIWNAANDGASSGLDADLLDGNHASAFQLASTALTTSTNFGGDVSGTYNNIVVADDSHNHIIGNVDGLQSALDGKLSTTLKGTSNGLAELDSTGKVPSSQLPSYVDDVLEYADLASFPTSGEEGKIYIAWDTNKTYRWSGTGYIEISASLALGETSSTAYRGDRGKTAYDHSQVTTGSIHGSSTVGTALFRISNNSTSIKFIRVNADNTLTYRTGSEVLSDIGAYAATNPNGYTTNTGTVTSVGGTGSVAGLTLTGTVTTTGNLTLGGTLSTPVSTINDSTTVGQNLVKLTNPSAITFLRINADNSVSTLNATDFRTAIGAGTSSTTGTVTSVAALTIGTTGTDITSTVANGTTTPVITLNIPTASASNRGALSSTDWTTFNNKQNALTNPVTGTGTTNYISKWTGTTTQGNSLIYDNGTNVAVGGITNPGTNLHVYGGGSSAQTPTNVNGLFVENNGTSNSNYVFQTATGSGKTFSITNAGYVGIGTTSPGSQLHVLNTGSEAKILIENETLALLQFKQPTSNKTYNIELGRTDGELSFRSTTGEKVRITEGGDVGIGTTTPATKLDVRHTGGSTDYELLRIGNNSNASDVGMRIGFWDDASGTFWSKSTGAITVRRVGSGSTGAMLFTTRDSQTTESAKMVITGGNVGIGTTSPSHRLQLGTTTSTSTATPETISLGGTFSSSAGGNAKLRLWTDGSNVIGLGVSSNQLDYICSAAYSHVFYNNGSESWRITSAGVFQSNGAKTIQTSTGNLTLATAAGNGHILLSPHGTGNVGIGTSTPGSTLDVRGSAVFNEDGGDNDFRVEGDTDANLLFVDASTDRIGIGTATPSYKLQVNGSFGATTKSFRIDHPSRPNYTLEYGSLESPYHGVRLTGRGKVVKGSGTVLLPSYLKDLIHDDETINIQITNIKHGKTIYVDEIDLNNDQFTVKVDRAKTLGTLEFFWTFTGTRKDVDKLVVEAEK